MKRNIILMGLAMLGATAAAAQNPAYTTVEVEMNDGQTYKVETIEGIQLSFLGTKGIVMVPVNALEPWNESEYIDTDNCDVYGRIYNVAENSALVYLGSTSHGFVISKESNAEPDTIIRSSAYGGPLNLSEQFSKGQTVEIPHYNFMYGTLTLDGLEYNTTYYVRPFRMIASIKEGESIRMYGEELKFITTKTTR